MAQIIKEPVSSLPLHSQRMLQVMKYVVGNAINHIDSETAFLKSINYTHANNLKLIKNNVQSFRIVHLQKCCEVYHVDANFFMLFKHTKMFKDGRKTSALAHLKEAVQMVSLELSVYKNV